MKLRYSLIFLTTFSIASIAFADNPPIPAGTLKNYKNKIQGLKSQIGPTTPKVSKKIIGGEINTLRSEKENIAVSVTKPTFTDTKKQDAQTELQGIRANLNNSRALIQLGKQEQNVNLTNTAINSTKTLISNWKSTLHTDKHTLKNPTANSSSTNNTTNTTN